MLRTDGGGESWDLQLSHNGEGVDGGGGCARGKENWLTGLQRAGEGENKLGCVVPFFLLPLIQLMLIMMLML